MIRTSLVTIVLACAMAVGLSGCCGKILQPDDPMGHHMGSLRYLAMPVTVPQQSNIHVARIGASSHSGRILRAGTPVRIGSMRDTGLVIFKPVQDTAELCTHKCVVSVSLEPDSTDRPFFEDVFTYENSLSDIDPGLLRQIQQHRVVEGMTADEVVLAVGTPEEEGDTSHVFYRESQARYEGEATHYWEYPERRVYFAGDHVIDATTDAEPIIEFESRCD